MDDECTSYNSNLTFSTIEMILSSISFLCCITMIFVYKRSNSFQTFSYTIQFYILLGTLLYTIFDVTFSISYLASDCQPNKSDPCICFDCLRLQDSICQITSYLSVFGLMNIASWQLVLIKITKEAILYRKQEQLAVHLKSVGFAFFFPIITTIIPQLSDQSIYGLNGSVCWLQYNISNSTYINNKTNCTNSTNSNSDSNSNTDSNSNSNSDSNTPKPDLLVVITLLCFFLPIIFQSIVQLIDIQQINKKIDIMRSNKLIFKGHENHIKAIKSLILVPLFFLISFLIPSIFYLFELFNDYVSNIYFQIFKSIQSCIGIVILVMFSQNSYIRLKFYNSIKLREKSVYDHQIDLFQGLEEFDMKKSDLNKQF